MIAKYPASQGDATAGSMIHTVVPGTLQGWRLCDSLWYGASATAVHGPVALPEGVYSMTAKPDRCRRWITCRHKYFDAT
jgi:hypothetical protein